MYSNQVFAQNQTENEAEIEADIEQENKCKKDTECENQNEINNQLNVVNQQQNTSQTGEPETTCETCFTDNLTPEQITVYEGILDTNTVFTSIEELCIFIKENPESIEISSLIYFIGSQAGIDNNTLEEIDLCLEDFFGITIPSFG